MSSEFGTPLFYAAALCLKDMVQLLISMGAQVIPYDPEGNEEPSPLVIAASKGNIEIVKILLEAGAQIDSGYAWTHSILAGALDSKFYSSAIEAAEMEGHENVVALLRGPETERGLVMVDEVEEVQVVGRLVEVSRIVEVNDQ